jgi:enoyl-CoA hydratase
LEVNVDLENLIFEKEGLVAFITLNRPEVYNALNFPLYVELARLLEEIKNDAATGVVIVTGAGGKALFPARISRAFRRLTASAWEKAKILPVFHQLEGSENLPSPPSMVVSEGWNSPWHVSHVPEKRMGYRN